MKAPGLLYRISFLIILNSLFIFAAVTFVSFENNQSKIDRLISYRYDYISRYYQEEAGKHSELVDKETTPPEMAQTVLDDIFKKSEPYMKGLAGLVLLKYDSTRQTYSRLAQSFRGALGTISDDVVTRIAGGANYKDIVSKGIHVSPQIDADGQVLKTVYIPWRTGNGSLALAVAYLPQELLGSGLEFKTTLILLFLVITLISLLIVNLLFTDFIRPLKHLILGMEKTAKGEVLYQVEDVKNDEIGRVAKAFNAMSSSLWEQRKMLTVSNKNLSMLNQRMTETLSQLATAHKSLAKSEAFLSKLIANSPYPVIVTDLNRKIITFSDAALKTFKISEEAAIGKDFSEFFPFAPHKLFPQDEEEGHIIDEEMICKKSSGEHFPVLLTRVAIRENEKGIDAFLFILRDISESASFQEMIISIDRMATRGVMAGEIAHEVNNYLAIILGNVELLPLLLSKGKMDKVEQKLGVLRQTVTKIQRFAEGLMGYGNDEAVFVPGDWNQLVENMVAFLKPQNRYDGIDWEMNLSPHLPLVEFDRSQMQQLLVNLLNNAADALKEIDGAKRISVSTEVGGGGEFASITISDNAGGLPDDIHDVIFKQRYTGRRRGRGFGLFIVKQIIDKHSGRITYTSEAGQGTSFTITIPVKKQIEQDVSEQSQVIS